MMEGYLYQEGVSMLKNGLESTESINVYAFYVPHGQPIADFEIQVPPAMTAFYQSVRSLEIHWTPKNEEELPFVFGRIRILPIEQVFSDWEGIVWFEGVNNRMSNFKIVDFFQDEACVGFFQDEGENPNMYFYNFHGMPHNLHVKFDAYIQLLFKSYGFAYWQLMVLALISGKESIESEDFRKYMPILFEGFVVDDFIALFETVRCS
jgi:hypothetical protein